MTAGTVLTNASPTAQHLYRGLLTALRPIGTFREELTASRLTFTA